MPSVNSSSVPNVLDSSTVMTPSLPTLSKASAISRPISGSRAEMVATLAMSSVSSTSRAKRSSSVLTASTAASMPRLRPTGFAPDATARRPRWTSAWASTVAVVVPSPATSLVLVATSLTSWAPMFSNGSSSSTSLAIDTPSLVIVGAPNFLSRTTLRPLGPSVTLTALASLLTPASRARRASSSNFRIFAMWRVFLLLDLGQHVAAGEDQEILAVDGDLGAAVLAVEHDVAFVDVEGEVLALVVAPAAGADSEHGALLRLLLGGVGDDQARGGALLGLVGLHDDAVIEWLQGHGCWPPVADTEWIGAWRAG